MADFEKVLSKLQGVRRSGNTAMAQCPAHQDKSQSLSVKEREDTGKILLNCFAGCTGESIIRAAGLSWPDIYPEDGYKPTASKHTREEIKSAQWLLELVPIWGREGTHFTEKDRQDIYHAQRIVNAAKARGLV
jgi:hypothetical protein